MPDFRLILLQKTILFDLSDIGSYLIGYADTMTSDEVITWKEKGFNRTILTSALNRNVRDIVAQILDERK